MYTKTQEKLKEAKEEFLMQVRLQNILIVETLVGISRLKVTFSETFASEYFLIVLEDKENPLTEDSTEEEKTEYLSELSLDVETALKEAAISAKYQLSRQYRDRGYTDRIHIRVSHY